MKQVIAIALPVIIFTAMLVVGINHEVEQQKEVAIMRNDVDNMSSQVERYIDMLDDASDMAVEIYDDFNTAAIGFYRQTNVDSMRVHYNDVRQCYKLAEKYTIDNVKVELQFSEILQRKNRQTDRLPSLARTCKEHKAVLPLSANMGRRLSLSLRSEAEPARLALTPGKRPDTQCMTACLRLPTDSNV